MKVEHADELLTAAYLDGTLDAAAVESVERHLAQCARCRAAVVSLRHMPQGETAPRDLVAQARARGDATRARLPGRVTLAAAAVLVLAVLGGTLVLRRAVPQAEAPLERGPAAPAGGLQAQAPSAGAAVEGPEVVLRWSPEPLADRYLVTVRDGGGAVVVTLEARPPERSVTWRPPPDRARPMTALWQVRALRGDRVLAETRPVAFEVR